MQRVLLRVFPEPSRQDVVGMEKLITIDDEPVFGDDDMFVLSELGERKIEKRPDAVPENADYALHFLAKPGDVLSLAGKPGWAPIRGCATCPRTY